MTTSNSLFPRLTSDAEVSISRKWTEEHHRLGPPALSLTPQRDKESKRRRLTSDSVGGVIHLRSNGEIYTAADIALGATLGCTNPEEIVMEKLKYWSAELTRLQPKVHVSDHLMKCGLCLFKNLRYVQWQAAIDGKFSSEYFNNPSTNHHDLAACYWIALKHCSIRTAVPNRTLMSRATGCDAFYLADQELTAILWMDWEINAVLRLYGLVQDDEEAEVQAIDNEPRDCENTC